MSHDTAFLYWVESGAEMGVARIQRKDVRGALQKGDGRHTGHGPMEPTLCKTAYFRDSPFPLAVTVISRSTG